MPGALERELKLLAPDELVLPSLSELLPGLAEGTPVRQALDATYYDTADLGLARSGVTVRFRSGEAGAPWTVKLPESAGESSLTRVEVRLPGRPDTVPTAARDLVRAYLRAQRLRPVARVCSDRSCTPLLQPDGSQAAELVDDRVSVYDGEVLISAFREIELELTGASHPGRLLKAARRRLLEAGCQDEPPRPKLVRALGERAAAPPDVVVTPVGPKATLSELIRTSLASSVQRLVSHDAAARLGQDPEGVHQLRVAARTLRSNLKTFAPLLEDDWTAALRAELGWLGTEAGRVRDLDVLEARLRNRIDGLCGDDHRAATALIRRLTQQRRQARREMLRALRSRRYDRLVQSLVEAAATPLLNDDVHPAAPARGFLREAAARQARHLDRAIAATADPPTDAELHQVRIRAKRTRYAIEAARPVIGKPAAKHAAALADLQDVLGDLHDSVVAERWLRAAAADRPECALAAGQLVGMERADRARLRGEAGGLWARLGADKLRGWL